MSTPRSAFAGVHRAVKERALRAFLDRARQAEPGSRLYSILQWLASNEPTRFATLAQRPPRRLVFEPLPRPTLPDSALPTMSIVTPSFQQGRFLARTLRSVIDQRYPGLEYVVMDGGSTDLTTSVLREHAHELTHWQSLPDGGQAEAVANGFARCTGEIMAWLNSDDLYAPGALRLAAETFVKNPDVDVIYGNRYIVDEFDREIGRWILPPYDAELLRWIDYVPQETLFWRRRVWEAAGGIDTSFRFALDYDLLLRLQRVGARFLRVPALMGCFRVHDAHKTGLEWGTVGAREVALLRERELGPGWSASQLDRNGDLLVVRSYVDLLAWRRGLRA